MKKMIDLQNGFAFIEGDYVKELETDDTQLTTLNIINSDIESYDEVGVYFTIAENMEVYIQNVGGEREYFELSTEM